MQKNAILLLLCFAFIDQALCAQSNLSKKYNLLPWPKEINKNSSKVLIDKEITISINSEDHGRVHKATINFLRRLTNRTGVFINNGFPLTNVPATIEIYFDSIGELNIHCDESYTLNFNNNKIKIKAKTDIGALRAIQTLLQLVTNDEDHFYFEGADINDSPRFVWRGLMIDTARHFQPVDVLKRNLDAMASVKLNVFHWHLTDDQGFRIESKVYPRLHEIASDGLYYTQEQIKDVVEYASNLGIRVVPEIDVPGHASAILTAYPEYGSKDDFVYSIERYAGVFDPTLNPTKKSTYEFLDNLFSEVAPLFPDEYFHIGGDENEGKHWNENTEIQEFKKKHNLKTNHDLQTYFNIKLEKILKKLDKKLMGWDEILTPSIPKTAVIHSWRGEHEGLEKSTLIEAAQKGYQAVLSAGYYIDRMLSVEHHYLVDPIGDETLTREERKRILGAEATMWSELVTPLTIESRIWPRTAAIAERFWSLKNIKDVSNMRKRLKVIYYQLEELGINHIRNKKVILRNISKNPDIKSLEVLSRICEPLKIYSRNKGGIEYKSFSPFTLFADACTADAEDAIEFNNLISLFIENQNQEYKIEITNFLTLWANNHADFIRINKNPNTKPLELLSKKLSDTSKLFLTILSSKKINLIKYNNLKSLLTSLEAPFMDVELAIIPSLKTLLSYCLTNYLMQ